jgi:DnaA family protein
MFTSDSSTHLQLALPFYLNEKHTFENFYPGANHLLVRCLKALILGEAPTPMLYMWGHQGVGCTHLLQASYYYAKANKKNALYFSLEDVQQKYTANDLQCLIQGYDIVCIEALESIANQIQWEEALFHVYNILIANSTPMIFAAHQVPKQLTFTLPDLISRLNSGLLFQVHELNDQEKLRALQLRAKLHGLELSESVAQFLLSRLARDSKALFGVLEQLDQSSLIHQRKLTIPFVKEILKL